MKLGAWTEWYMTSNIEGKILYLSFSIYILDLYCKLQYKFRLSDQCSKGIDTHAILNLFGLGDL